MINYADRHDTSMNGAFDKDNFTASGHLFENGSFEPYTLVVENGILKLEKGACDGCDINALFAWDLINAHTHCADYGLSIPNGMSLEELVAPPDGLKHRYLKGLSDSELRENIRSFDRVSSSKGAAAFIDFREEGVKGCLALRESSQDAIVLGRPVSDHYDPEEIHSILQVADGIGLPSISDMPIDYIEAVADDVRNERKIFAIHASERIREDIDTVLSLDPAFIVHMCEADDDDLVKCAEAEVPVVLCPTSNSYFGKVTPIKRMIDNGVDFCVGTDNGMLCEPDIVKEAGILASMLQRQGGNPYDAWIGLLISSSKLLNRIIRMEDHISGRYLTVMPCTGTKEGCTPGPFGPFRIKRKRGEC